MNNDYKVYMHRFPNGKVYIGITCQKPEYRWNKGKHYRKQPLIFNAIMKYGWDNIEHIILFDGLSKEDAETKEVELISLYDSTNREKGYNIENGGNSTGKHSEETKKKMSAGIKNAYKNTEYKEKKIAEAKKSYAKPEYKKQLSERTKRLWQSKEYRTKMISVHRGKTVSAEARKKVSDARKGRFMGGDNVNARAVEQYTKDGVFVACWDSAMSASRATGANNAKICECCKGKRHSAGGYRWKYAAI